MNTHALSESAQTVEDFFKRAGIRLTIGAEPTFVPAHPKGAEWSYSALGPTKLGYARRLAGELLRIPSLHGGMVMLSPGKLYPGEVNPRWVLHILAPRKEIHGFSKKKTPPPSPIPPRRLLEGITAGLGLRGEWHSFRNNNRKNIASVLPLDFQEGRWITQRWPLADHECILLDTEGPAGLRLPLDRLPSNALKRALVVEWKKDRPSVFLPPLSQEGFLKLHRIIEDVAAGRVDYEGYLPEDERGIWTRISISADPGVLEINLPPSETWEEFSGWMHTIYRAAKRCGLHARKRPRGDHEQGTSGGCHLLLGGPKTDENPFFTRPAWIASLIRYFHAHPSLAYVFTGQYVGPWSQAPRVDESAKPLSDYEMACDALCHMKPGDRREDINSLLRHLMTDISGNTHRTEISFDKFWNSFMPSGCQGLLEFRAFESLPHAEWINAAALLLRAIAARTLNCPVNAPLQAFGMDLHDRWLLPHFLWKDVESVLSDLTQNGFSIPCDPFRAIWEWRFPRMLTCPASGLCIRRAAEPWPLLTENPPGDATTSRYVDTSMRRLEFSAPAGSEKEFRLLVQGRELPLRTNGGIVLAGLRYRHSRLQPCLHPHIPVHLPLRVALFHRKTGRCAGSWILRRGNTAFQPAPPRDTDKNSTSQCARRTDEIWTYDLRMGKNTP